MSGDWLRAAVRAEAVLADPLPKGPVPAGVLRAESSGHAARESLSANRANAPADTPEDADTLPARDLRPDLPRRTGEAVVDEPESDDTPPEEAEPDDKAADEPGTSAPEEGSRGTPGISQPGSAIAASLHPRDRLNINRSRVR